MDEQELQPPSSQPGCGAKRSDVVGGGWGTSNMLGKHRMAAAISHLHQQINIIQQELDQLETIGHASSVCNEFISRVESVPDPLLPMIKGPTDMRWERWFQGTQSSRKGSGCKRSISS